MADENTIRLDFALDESSVESSFKALDERAEKSAKESAKVFEQEFKQQEQKLQESIQANINATKTVATKSAKESADAFQRAFAESARNQQAIYKASVKQNLDNAIGALTGGDRLKKSAAESAEVFQEAFANKTKGFEGPSLDVGGGAGIAGLATKIGLASAAFFAFKKSAEAAFDVVVAGEQKIKLEKRFETLATSAGVAASVLENDMNKAVKGLVDDDALLELASQSFIQLGASAKQLPQILELAQKTYKVFGGSIVANTEAINQAIFSGNTRQLRQLGLLIDTDSVYKNYAKTLGTVPALLTQQQKQTALLNAVLEQGSQKFKNISTDVDNAKDAFTRAKVSFTQLTDELAKNSAKNYGGFFKSLATSASEFFDGITNGLKALKGPANIGEAQARLESLKVRLNEAKIAFENFDASVAGGAGAKAALFTRLKDLEASEKRLKSFIADQREVQKLLDQRTSKIQEPPKDSTVEAETIRRKQELVAKVQQLNDAQNQSEVALAQAEFQRSQTRANLEKFTYEQRKYEAEKFRQEQAALEKFYSDNGIIDETLREQGREAQRMAHVNRMLQIDADYVEKKKAIFNEAEIVTISAGEAFNQVATGAMEAAQELSISASKNFKALGKQMFATMGSAAGNAFAAFGAAIANGEDALAAFGKSLLNSLGQAAIQMGTTFILQGIAYTYAGLANGPPLIAAGAALAAVGGLLSASSGTGPKDVSGGGTAGGISGGADTSPINEPQAPADTVAQTPQTAINLTINGNVLDRRETGLEIASILEEQFAGQGLTIRGAS